MKPYKVTTRSGDKIYIIDTAAKSFVTIDSKKNFEKTDISLDYTPISFVVTNDEKKAYITYRKSISDVGVCIIDLMGKKVLKNIQLKDFPDGITLSPNGKYVYIIMHYGASEKTLYVIDSKTDQVIKSIPDIGVGSAIGVTPDGKKMYVSSIGNDGTNQINVIDLVTFKSIKTIEYKAISFAFTSDTKHVFAVGVSEVAIIRTDEDKITNRMPFASSPDGLAISDDRRAFVWLPKENRTFIFPIDENLENEIGFDPETNFKQFKQELKSNANTNQFEMARDFFAQLSSEYNAAVDGIIQELGKTFGNIQSGYNPDYKNLSFSNQYGITSMIDKDKLIWPVYQAKLTESELIVIIQEKDKSETFKAPRNSFQWLDFRKFVRNFFLKRIDQLR